MKRKLILLPITLTTLSPVVGLVGCGDPKPVYHEYELKEIRKGWYATDKLTLLKDNNYKFCLNNLGEQKSIVFGFLTNLASGEVPVFVDVDDVKVLVNGKENQFIEEKAEAEDWWQIYFLVGELPANVEIYLRCNETKENVYGVC